MNNAVISGSIVQEPQLRYTPDNQTPLAGLMIEIAPLKEGDRPSIIKAVAWGNTSDDVMGRAIGEHLILEGRIQINSIQSPEGFKENRAEFVVSKVHPVSSPVVINVVTLVGRFGQQPDVKYFESGSVVAKGSMAVDRPKKGSDPDWHNYEAWGKTAEVIANYGKKGTQCGVTGSFKMEYWTDRNTGTERSKPVVKVERFEFVGSKRDQEAEGDTGFNTPVAGKPPVASVAGRAKTSVEPSYDDMPF